MSGASGAVLVVDRFEGEVVVLESGDGTMLDLPRRLLPAGLAEGDVLHARVVRGPSEATVVFTVDPEETGRRRAAAARTLERLRARDPGGDIEL